jgi:hypothetical protein
LKETVQVRKKWCMLVEEKSQNRERTNVKWTQVKAMANHSWTTHLAYEILHRITRSLTRLEVLLTNEVLTLTHKPTYTTCLKTICIKIPCLLYYTVSTQLLTLYATICTYKQLYSSYIMNVRPYQVIIKPWIYVHTCYVNYQLQFVLLICY